MTFISDESWNYLTYHLYYIKHITFTLEGKIETIVSKLLTRNNASPLVNSMEVRK
jgi:hypothetical protein